MKKRNTIKIGHNKLRSLVREAVEKIIENNINTSFRVEDYFDVKSLTKKEVQSIATNIRAFIAGQGYGSNISDDGNLILKEETNTILSIKDLRKELRKLGFKQWQIKSTIYANKVRVVILFADIDQNTKIIENKMFEYGWTKSHISEPLEVQGVMLRIMDFDPKEQKSLSKEARRNKYLYHWTPYGNLKSILKNGIEARSENEYLSYPHRVHLMKSNITKNQASSLGWQLFNRNSLLNDGKFALLRINVNKMPGTIEFYGDPRYEGGYYTNDTIPPEAITLFGEIYYKDKEQYNDEKINVLSNDDTMI